jgi:hypothetical protein
MDKALSSTSGAKKTVYPYEKELDPCLIQKLIPNELKT